MKWEDLYMLDDEFDSIDLIQVIAGKFERLQHKQLLFAATGVSQHLTRPGLFLRSWIRDSIKSKGSTCKTLPKHVAYPAALIFSIFHKQSLPGRAAMLRHLHSLAVANTEPN